MQPEALSGTLANIADSLAIVMDPQSWEPVRGGDINQAGRLTDSNGRTWFIKFNNPDRVDMFAAECEGLRELAIIENICVPQAAGYGKSEHFAWLVLEWLDLAGAPEVSDQQLGQALARMHQITAGKFGWHRDNYIGTTTQVNGWVSN